MKKIKTSRAYEVFVFTPENTGPMLLQALVHPDATNTKIATCILHITKQMFLPFGKCPLCLTCPTELRIPDNPPAAITVALPFAADDSVDGIAGVLCKSCFAPVKGDTNREMALALRGYKLLFPDLQVINKGTA